MENNNPNHENSEETKPQIHINELGTTKDSTVVVEEADRTVLLTDNETIVIPKATLIDVPTKNRERKVYGGMWGNTELITVGVAMLAILTTILLFVFLVLPAQKELSDNRTKRDDLDKQLQTAQSRYGTITTTEKRVADITSSVDDFEARFLKTEVTGKTALYQHINGLINAYGLTNTSGPDYAPLEIADQNRNNQQQSEAEKGRSRFMSIYPGVYVTMTLDGSYQNLRRFIREIETNQDQFVIISSIELEPSDNKEKQEIDPTKPPPTSINQTVNPAQFNPNNPTAQANPNGFPQQQPPQSLTQNVAKVDRGKTRGETVTLRLELAAYFRRVNSQVQTVRASVQP
jgi:hypothetical protein